MAAGEHGDLALDQSAAAGAAPEAPPPDPDEVREDEMVEEGAALLSDHRRLAGVGLAFILENLRPRVRAVPDQQPTRRPKPSRRRSA